MKQSSPMENMPVRTRRLLFLSLTFLFIIVGIGLVLYSRGSRLDFTNWQVVQTGGIYLKTEPADVIIKMNGEPVENKSGLLQAGTLISNLKPGIYKINISRENYHSWEKEVRVGPSSVAVFDGIILFPKQKTELFASPTDKFYLEDNKLLTKNGNNLIFEKNQIIGNEVVTFSEGGLALTYRTSNKNYYLTDVFEPESPLNLTLLFNQLKEKQLKLPGEAPITKILPYPFNDRKFVVMTEKALYTLDSGKQVLAQVASGTQDFALGSNEVFWFDHKRLFSFNLVFRAQTPIPLPEEFKVTDSSRVEVSPSGETIAFLKKSGELVILEQVANEVKSLGREISHFIFSPNSKKLAFVSQKRLLNVYGIKDGVKEDKFILENFSSPGGEIEELLWHEDNNYIFLKGSNGNLYFVEINDYPPINVVTVAEEVGNFLYNKDDDSLYFGDEKGIWQIKL